MLITKNFIVKLKKIIDLIKKYSQISFIKFLLRCFKWIFKWTFIFIVICIVIFVILKLYFILDIGLIFSLFLGYFQEWIYLIKDWNFFLWMIALGQFWITKLMIATGADVNLLSKESEQTPLMIAARFNNSPKITELLIKKGADPRFVSTKLSAIHSDDLGVIQEIINKDLASFFVAKQLGSNALMSASAGGSVKIAKIILDLIPKDEVKDYINLKSKDGNNILLHNLNRNPSLEVVKLLVKNGANINYANMLQFIVPSPLRLAAIKNKKIFKYLISNGGDINFIQSNGHSLLQASVYSGQTQLVKLLINSGADLNCQGKGGKTALISAVEMNNLKLAKILIKAGADLNINSEWKGTALYYAVSSFYRGIFSAYTTKMIKLLIDSGADLNIDCDGDLAFVTAAGCCSVEVLKMFLEAGVDINQTNILKETALIKAAGSYINAKFLIDNGIDIHKEGKSGDTVLGEAVILENIRLVKLLIKLGLDVNHRDAGNRTPILHVAKYTFNTEILTQMLQILIEAGAAIDAQDKDGNTALMIAIKRENIKCAELLIEFGANINIKNKEGYTARDLHQILIKKGPMNRRIKKLEDLQIKGLF